MNDEAKEQVQVRHVEEEEGEPINTCSYHGLGQESGRERVDDSVLYLGNLSSCQVVVVYYYSDSGRVYDRIRKNGKVSTELVEY